MGPTACMDVVAKKKSTLPPGIEPCSPSSVNILSNPISLVFITVATAPRSSALLEQQILISIVIGNTDGKRPMTEGQ
jgi:hypothetical protein